MSTPKTQPFLSPGRHTYNAPVTDWQGKRSNKSLGTKDVSEARAICRELNDLAKSQLMPDDSALSLVSPIAYRLFYNEEKFIKLDDSSAPVTGPIDRGIANVMLAELVALRKQVKELQGFKDRYEALSNSIEGRRLKAEEVSPTMAAVAAAYALDVANLSRKGSLHKTWFKRFSVHVGTDCKISAITPGQIAEYIQLDAAKHPGETIRTKKTRALVSRFFHWAAINHGVPNPMDQVPAPRIQGTRDIAWHTIEEVEAVLGKLPTYWRGLVAVLAYAGLSAHELRGLRREDLHETKSQAKAKGKRAVKGLRFLRVTPHDKRSLKTSKRQRNVAISKRLAPILDAHLAELSQDSEYLFPALTGSGPMWKADTLTDCIGTWLPKGMTCLSLRRTFGSLLIRSGRTAEEVSAAMGNSPAMVHAHYARILGGEVEIDF